ncbi:TMAO reductase system periplasmic protein TorT [Ferrimonas sp. YFM]|uniref:TMAO reductase system periplasmic protein TorT n=1 Tax=Ferrimonas sp. YFM TaxID=3028878 RepID=UPI0025740B81|nr:TMAO reductase system periplasmic protein TorT [Ferrimonas sp. YFM]BDY04942.1 TMAO reductase system periplasmic protein TorT [Ferrimonas sp. YFM]
MLTPSRAALFATLFLASKPLYAAPFKVCALYPHLKDSYWISVNQGMAERAKEYGMALKVMEAGGYANQDTQVEQFYKCQAWGADLVLLGSVSYQIDPRIKSQFNKTPTLAVINQVEPDSVIATVGVSWYEMGKNLGLFINSRFKPNSRVKTLIMYGPRGRGGNQFINKGVSDAVEPDRLEVVGELYGSNSAAVQRQLLKDYLADNPVPELIIGGAVSTEVAVNELRQPLAEGKTRILSSYLTHGVYRALLRGKILMANSDQMRLQGKMSIDAAHRWQQGEILPKVMGPSIISLTPGYHLDLVDDSLSSPGFMPIYEVTAEPNR